MPVPLIADEPSAAQVSALREAIFQPAPVDAQTQIVTGGENESSCTVTLTCNDGTVISCSSSNSDCHSYSTYIVCDGVRKDCPSTPSSPSCNSVYVRCPDGLYMACPNGSQYCETWGPYCLMCDGVIKRCPRANCPF